jgi:G3E family GTPase
VKGSLIQTIEKLMKMEKKKNEFVGQTRSEEVKEEAKEDEDETKAFDYILLETTGLANPGPICGELWVDDALLEDNMENAAVLDSVVCVADAKNIERQLEEHVEAREQIAYADVIVLNKADLVETEEELKRIREKLESINADAKLVVSERSKVDLSQVLDQKSYKGNVKSRLMKETTTTTTKRFFAKGAKDLAMRIEESSKSSNSNISSSKHDETITTVCLTAKGFVDKEKFENWIEDLLWEKRNEPNGADVLRCKGILKCKRSSDAPPLILQGVRDVYEITDGFDGLKLQEDGLSKVVLIGRRLRLDELRVGFESCFFL